jgi:flagellar FliL protein
MPQEIAGEQPPREQPKKGILIDQKVLLLGVIAVAICAVFALLVALFVIKGGIGVRDNSYQQAANATSQIGPLVEAGEFTTNLAPGGEKKYIKVKVILEVNDKEAEKEIQKKLPVLNDKIIVFLNSKTSDDLRAENRLQLKKGLLKDLNVYLQTGKIKNIYFSDLVMQ